MRMIEERTAHLQTKELTINGKIYAKYQLDKSSKMIYLNVVRKIFPDDELKSEDFLIQLISGIENVAIDFAGFLNID